MQVTPRNQTAPKLILIHGMLSTPLEFGLLAQPLRSRGIDHIALEIPGYSLADTRASHSWRNWLALTRATLDAVIAPGEPVILGGLCMGGVFAAALALEGHYNVQGLVMMSPTFEYDGWSLSRWSEWRKLAYLLRVDRLISISEREPFGIKNPKIRKWIARDMQQRHQSAAGPAKLPLRALREGERIMAWVAARLPSITCPTLVLHAREDEITSLASVERLFATIKNPAKELVVMEDSYHMITIDNDRARVVDELCRFVARLVDAPGTPLPAPVVARESRAPAGANPFAIPA